VPFTDNCDGSWYSVAVTIGYNSGCSTAKKETSTPEITLAGGGASASAFTFSVLHPPMTKDEANAIDTRLNPVLLLFIRFLAPAYICRNSSAPILVAAHRCNMNEFCSDLFCAFKQDRVTSNSILLEVSVAVAQVFADWYQGRMKGPTKEHKETPLRLSSLAVSPSRLC
jgi:hypothetical protein